MKFSSARGICEEIALTPVADLGVEQRNMTVLSLSSEWLRVNQRDPHAPSSSTTPILREARHITRFFLSHSSRPCRGYKTDLPIFMNGGPTRCARQFLSVPTETSPR